MLLVLTPLVINKIKIDSKFKLEHKIAIYLLAISAICLGIVVVFKLSNDPWRQSLDLTTVLALLVSVLVGVIITKAKTQLITIGILILIGIGLVHNIPTWFSYNSAITKVDIAAIKYVNSLDDYHYNCSTTIAPWIYNRFAKQEYTENESDLLIVRNKPMTPRSTEGNIWYIEPSKIYYPDKSYKLRNTFTDGDVTVDIYRK
jgi:hypothetical protein